MKAVLSKAYCLVVKEKINFEREWRNASHSKY